MRERRSTIIKVFAIYNIDTNLDQKMKIYLQNWWKPEVLGEKPSNLQKNYIESSTIMTFFMIQNQKIPR